MEKQSLRAFFKERIQTAIALDVVYAVYLAFCIGSGIYFGVTGITGTCIRSFAFTLFVPVIYFVEYFSRLRITPAVCTLMLFIGAGSLLGGGYNLYTVIPFFDTVLHGISGFVFACIGFSVLKVFLGNPQSAKQYFACLLVGFLFAMAVASLWELFEYTAHLVTGLDIEEDTVISGFTSFLISGDHNAAYDATGILQTIVYFRDGRDPLVIDGYLDIGLIDTICDMAICLGGAVLYLIALTADRFTAKKYLYRFFIPDYKGRKSEVTPTAAEPLENTSE